MVVNNQGGKIMQLIKYEELRKQNSGRLIHSLLDKSRGKINGEINVTSAAGLLWGAYIMINNDIKAQEDLLEFIKVKFKNELTKNYLLTLFEVEENYSLIKEVSTNESEDLLLSEILFGTTNFLNYMGRQKGENITPDSVIQLAVDLLDLKSTDVVYDATSGVSNFLIEASMQGDVAELYGTELNREAIILSKIKEHLLELEINIELRDTIEEIKNHPKATKVFSDSPFGIRVRDMGSSIKNNKALVNYLNDCRVVSGDWIFAISAMLAQKDHGKTVVSMVSGSLFNEADKGIREKLIKDGRIEAVIALPSNLYSNTAIPVNLLVLSENNTSVRMINAANQFTELNRIQNHLTEENIKSILEAFTNITDISKDVTLEYFEKEDFVLSPVRYMGYLLEESDGLPLSQVTTDIIRGAMISKKELDELTTDNSDYKYVQIKDIENGMIKKNLSNLSGIEDKYKKAFIQNGDILMSKTAPFKFAIVDIDDKEKVVATGSLYILRPDQTKIDSTYLNMFLQSKLGQEQLKRYVTGTTIPTLSVAAFNKLIIPQKDKSTQNQLAKEYKKLQEDLIFIEKQKEHLIIKQKDLLEEAF